MDDQQPPAPVTVRRAAERTDARPPRDAPFRDRAIDGRRHFGQSLRQYALPDGLLGKLADRAGVRLPPPEPPYVFAGEQGVFAELHGDAWVVRCPVAGCGGASFAWPDEPLFLCADCFNAATDGLWRVVVFPDDAPALEEVVGYRTLPRQRNWAPGETLDDLLAQNAEAGDDVPPQHRGRLAGPLRAPGAGARAEGAEGAGGEGGG